VLLVAFGDHGRGRPWSGRNAASGGQHERAAQVERDGEQLQLQRVLDQAGIAHTAVAVPALEDREGPLDRRADPTDHPVARGQRHRAGAANSVRP
jgi:hypothetical protein